MKYLTVNQYKRYSDGVSLADVTDVTLALTIKRAETQIDAHMGFDLKRGGFEPHNVMIQQRFDEKSLKTFHPHYYIPVRQVQRYRIQVSNISTSGAGFFANINSADCVINNDDDYIEIVPLQAVTYSLSPVLLQLGLKPPIVQMDCEVGYYNPVFGEQLIDKGNHLTYYATSGFWAQTYDQALHAQPNQLPPVPPNIYVNGVAQSGNYTIDYTDGSVTFNSMQLPTAIVTADYTKQIPDIATEAAVLQTTHLLAQRHLNTLGMFKGLYHMKAGEQEIGYPRSVNVADQGRSTASGLCDDAAAVLARYDEWAIA